MKKEQKEQNERKYRLRYKGYSIGQINPGLWELYKGNIPYSKDTTIIQRIIEDEILGHECKTLDDVILAEKLVRNMYYSNIGEFIECYIRNKLSGSISVCKNCSRYGYCKKNPYAFQKICT